MKYLRFALVGFLILSCRNIPSLPDQQSTTVYDSSDEQQNPIPETRAIYNSDAIDYATMDTIYIGANRTIKSLEAYLGSSEEKENDYLLIDEGTYYSDEKWLHGNNLVIEGIGAVNIYCTESNDNVLWISGDNIVVRNIHMKHLLPGEYYGQNCSGRVIGFDIAHNVLIENCDLNGCGLAGLHDNGGNSAILIRNNYIHNNSLGAYTDINGGVWQEEVDDHPVFTFENNRIENNGQERILELYGLEDYIIDCPDSLIEELTLQLKPCIKKWKEVTNPFIATYQGDSFIDSSGNVYDFLFGSNELDAFLSFYMLSEEQQADLMNKSYLIYWEWRASNFYLRPDDEVMIEAYAPSLTSCEMLETEGDKK